MAYRAPFFYFLHAGRTAGVANVASNPAAATGFPLHYSIDGRGQSLFKFASSGAGSTYTVDRTAGGLEAVDALLIPSGHNLGSQTITVESDDNSGFSSATTLYNSTVAAGLIEKTLTSSTERYLRITFGGTGQWELGEVMFSRKRTTSSYVIADWSIPKASNVNVTRWPSGVIGATALGPDLQRGTLTFRWVSGSDRTMFDELQAACGNFKAPVYVALPDDTLATTLMLIDGDLNEWKQDSVNPQGTGPTYTISMDLIEAVG